MLWECSFIFDAFNHNCDTPTVIYLLKDYPSLPPIFYPPTPCCPLLGLVETLKLHMSIPLTQTTPHSNPHWVGFGDGTGLLRGRALCHSSGDFVILWRTRWVPWHKRRGQDHDEALVVRYEWSGVEYSEIWVEENVTIGERYEGY